jgi:1-acyl-sn-glycerol-3-phosphate acyltransferase
MTRASFFGVPGFGALLRSLGAFPVRRGVSDLRAFRRAQQVLKDGGALLLFPEGGRMKDGLLHRGLPGLGLLAAHTRVPVVPIHIDGTNHIRRCIARRAKVRIAIGEPLPEALWPQAGDTSTRAGRDRYQAISDRVMQEIARLRDETRGADSQNRGERN